MYNRYIPQPDGSFRRSTVREPQQQENSGREHTRTEFCPPEKEEPQRSEPPREEQPRRKPGPCPNMRPPRPYRSESHHRQNQRDTSSPKSTGVTDFLRQLLPKNFDTGDLLIVILLLLMSGDCAEDQNTALLTLAIYLFL